MQWKNSASLRLLSFNIDTRVREDKLFSPYHPTVIKIKNIVQINGMHIHRLRPTRVITATQEAAALTEVSVLSEDVRQLQG
jgi:hypothetical protein